MIDYVSHGTVTAKKKKENKKRLKIQKKKELNKSINNAIMLIKNNKSQEASKHYTTGKYMIKIYVKRESSFEPIQMTHNLRNVIEFKFSVIVNKNYKLSAFSQGQTAGERINCCAAQKNKTKI